MIFLRWGTLFLFFCHFVMAPMLCLCSEPSCLDEESSACCSIEKNAPPTCCESTNPETPVQHSSPCDECVITPTEKNFDIVKLYELTNWVSWQTLFPRENKSNLSYRLLEDNFYPSHNHIPINQSHLVTKGIVLLF